MKDASGVYRPSKRDVITISDDESSVQPVVKTARRETESVLPTRKVVDTTEKVDELEMRLVIATSQLESTERRAEKAYGDIRILSEEKKELFREVECLKSTIDNNTIVHERLQKRIDELTRRLAKYENPSLQSIVETVSAVVSPPEVMAPSQEPEPLVVSTPVNISAANEIAHPRNLCRMIRVGAPDTISIDAAVSQLRAKYDECGEWKWIKYRQMVKLKENYSCDVCSKATLDPVALIHHFLSKSHISKFCALFSAVSLIALNHWLHVLQKAIDAEAEAAASAPENPSLQPIVETVSGVFSNLEMKDPSQERVIPLLSSILTPSVSPPAPVNEIAHPTSLFELIRMGAPDSISCDAAVYHLRGKFKECGGKQWSKYLGDKKYKNHSCKVCNKIFNPVVMFDHFFSNAHNAKIQSHCSAVSLIALNHWLHELQNAIDAAAAASATAGLSALAANPFLHLRHQHN